MGPTSLTYLFCLLIIVVQTSTKRSYTKNYGSKIKNSYENVILDSSAFTNGVLTVTTILIEPYTMVRWVNGSNYHPGGTDLYEGFIVDLLNHLSDIIGFKYRLVPVWDGQFGFRDPEAMSWNGMIGELMRQEADIAAGPMFITEHRKRVVDFTRPYLTVEATVLINKSPEGIPPEILSVRDLVNHPTLEYGTLDRGIIRRAFRLSNVTLYRDMWNYMKNNHDDVMTTSNDDGIDRVRRGNYAFILPNSIAEYIIRRKPCDLMMIDSFLLKVGYGLAVQKKSRLRASLDRALDTLEKDGYLRKLYEKWWIERGECHPVRSSRMFSYSKSSRHITSIPIVLFLCLILSIVS